MFSNLRSWWKKFTLRKQIERTGKAIAREAWEDVKALVVRMEAKEITGKEKFNAVLSQLKQKYRGILSESVLRTAIQLAVELLDDHLDIIVEAL